MITLPIHLLDESLTNYRLYITRESKYTVILYKHSSRHAPRDWGSDDPSIKLIDALTSLEQTIGDADQLMINIISLTTHYVYVCLNQAYR